MSTLLLTALLVSGFSEPKSDVSPKVEGKWLIVYAEESGKRNNAWEQQQASVEGNKLSYEAGGKQHALTLTFGAHQTLEATGGEQGGDNKDAAWHGVYVSSQDYFVVSLNKGAKGAAPGSSEEQEAKSDQAGTSSGAFILILRRQR